MSDTHDPAGLPKVGYLSGPVDARKVYDAWKDGSHTALFGTSYLLHWFAELERQGRSGVVVTSHAGEAYSETRGDFQMLNRPKTTRSGLRYHLDMIRWVRDRLREFEANHASTVILTDAQHYWFVTPPFRKRGMRFINSYHCALRALGHNRRSIHEFFIQLTSRRHLSAGDPTMAIVPTIFDELAKEPGSNIRPTFQLAARLRSGNLRTF